MSYLLYYDRNVYQMSTYAEMILCALNNNCMKILKATFLMSSAVLRKKEPIRYDNSALSDDFAGFSNYLLTLPHSAFWSRCKKSSS